MTKSSFLYVFLNLFVAIYLNNLSIISNLVSIGVIYIFLPNGLFCISKKARRFLKMADASRRIAKNDVLCHKLAHHFRYFLPVLFSFGDFA